MTEKSNQDQNIVKKWLIQTQTKKSNYREDLFPGPKFLGISSDYSNYRGFRITEIRIVEL